MKHAISPTQQVDGGNEWSEGLTGCLQYARWLESGNRRLLPSVIGNYQLPWFMASRKTGANGAPTPATKELLVGFVTRTVTGNQIRKALEHEVNPFTKALRTPQYRKILETRKKLPVYSQMDRFLKMFKDNQIIVIVGETGSGKTTQ
ncbi:hypothetical protein F5J12DRAFT_53488 [Pisolithus orientalis]|uniref:uncharacterized protein n=1 Tax=Pisolithus orientalis TaxID=936130 RepID=UPI002224736D|nr:uncharacterized protein F5J12DRAFT_53488 [Pisolithus orientalis]KAI6008786.1 hypothetical protein F5J12DRAFT_53488 [Pisolithus orientalis]